MLALKLATMPIKLATVPIKLATIPIELATVQVRHFISGTRDYMSPEAIVGKSVFASGNRFFEAQLSEFSGSTFRILRLNFPNSKAQLSEFSG